jgi:hypothetical protein
MERDDRCPSRFVPEFDVAAALADPREARLGERRDHIRSRDDRKPGTHAAITTEAMIGGSLASGVGTSSK